MLDVKYEFVLWCKECSWVDTGEERHDSEEGSAKI